MQKRFPTLLRLLATGLAVGLVCYGRYSGGLYWDYSDDWYDCFYEVD